MDDGLNILRSFSFLYLLSDKLSVFRVSKKTCVQIKDLVHPDSSGYRVTGQQGGLGRNLREKDFKQN